MNRFSLVCSSRTGPDFGRRMRSSAAYAASRQHCGDPGSTLRVYGINDPTTAVPVGGSRDSWADSDSTCFSGLRKYGAPTGEYGADHGAGLLRATRCDATSGVLGAAGPISASRDFPGAQKANTWYVSALPNQLTGVDLDPVFDPSGNGVSTSSRSSTRTLGLLPDVLEDSGFYLGLDANNPPNLDNLLSTVCMNSGMALVS